ncbi:hypothetical protein ANCDUO_03173 [Ancylostoma duodenale]|uniref:Uncharacterized protein n=1 Tax=Ancylostoma duodenale TaxID=51022 RepID=A0A0C2HAJ0_9BILA|nr:hypothetical protein ANCDUO_03173 [Ancylostoma duodenale]
MAYKKCIDWTDFLCNTKAITQHVAIDCHYFDSSYDEALKALRVELEEESERSRPKKTGPMSHAAGARAMLLEKDGQRGAIVTKVVASFDKLLQILEEWTRPACGSWYGP